MTLKVGHAWIQGILIWFINVKTWRPPRNRK